MALVFKTFLKLLKVRNYIIKLRFSEFIVNFKHYYTKNTYIYNVENFENMVIILYQSKASDSRSIYYYNHFVTAVDESVVTSTILIFSFK